MTTGYGPACPLLDLLIQFAISAARRAAVQGSCAVQMRADSGRVRVELGHAARPSHVFWEMVGAPRFELGTSWSRTKRATRLRHAPKRQSPVASGQWQASGRNRIPAAEADQNPSLPGGTALPLSELSKLRNHFWRQFPLSPNH